jgi:hypothetical protein
VSGSIWRVTDFEVPKVGMKAECLPGPPVTTLWMSAGLPPMGQGAQFQRADAVARTLEEEPLHILPRKAAGRDRVGGLGSEHHQHVAAND